MKGIVKRIVTSTFIFIFTITMSAFTYNSTPEFYGMAESQSLDITSPYVYYSEVLTFEEMVQYYAKENKLSYEDALHAFPQNNNLLSTTSEKNNQTYRIVVQYLYVTADYIPHINFYCETLEAKAVDGYWGITSIYNTELVRSYDGTSKQFSGTLKVWLRTPYKIEYAINGDFFNNGTTSMESTTGASVGIDGLFQVEYGVAISGSSSHYKYFFEHNYCYAQT